MSDLTHSQSTAIISRSRLRRFSAIELLVALILLFVLFPLVEGLKSGDLIIAILISVVLISTVFSVSGRGSILFIASLLAAAAVAARWANHLWPDLVPPEIFLIGGIVLIVFVVGHLLKVILNSNHVDVELLCISVATYLLLGLLWTLAYWLVSELIPGAFSFNTSSGSDSSLNGFNGFYFSFVTLSTVGYGDITPVAKVARLLAILESTTGLLYVAVLIARLVAIHSAPPPVARA